ncbi:UDP-N-acetylmuramate--L-alanine ligase [uncultured Ilyobacter sp.]|uniref:UDP-N-acetylmuramate--L-alanine ligase n=1 Tax=uncultured Ilyobacter sp. TaxID=544433 RepID=UPI0029F494EC|nr:UDP-N-acetylmuramate--L-alanine ligase [uncultured Ilyobacter sp.]
MKRVYFIGINGIGMSGLAKVMRNKGYEVVGADLNRNHRTEELEKMGIEIFGYHCSSNLKGCSLVVRSSAIKEGNSEYDYAVKNGIEVIKRGELLALLMNEEQGIAVAGTHGKTTTSSMLGAALLSLDPTIVVGGILPEINSNAKAGSSKLFIAEADESDNSFLYLNPFTSIITNIEADHLENHGSLENIEKSFIEFIGKTKDEVIVNIDCENIRKLIQGKEKIKSYSLRDESADIYASNIRVENSKIHYEVTVCGEDLGTFVLSVPGEHNVSNSLPVIYLAYKFGVEKEEMKKMLKFFKGAKRRYDILYDKNVKIIDDYAHHPTEIKATLQGARSIEKGKIVAVFQPHKYSRVKFLLEEFKGVFDNADEVVLLPVYSAGEKDEFGVGVEKLAEKTGHQNIRVEKNEDNISILLEDKENGTVFIFMGAGSISGIAHKITKNLER